jgi:hypothetical protein
MYYRLIASACTDLIGQSSLPSACPVCEHTPVAAEDCKPNKSLRTTIKVFLRTEEKKREDRRLKDIKNSPVATPATPVTPVEPAATQAIAVEPAVAPASGAKDEGPVAEVSESNEKYESDSASKDAGEELSLEAQKDIPQPSIEVIIHFHFVEAVLILSQDIAPGHEQIEDGSGEADTEDAQDKSGQTESAEKDSNDQSTTVTGMQPLGFGMGLGFDPTAAGGFPNMAAMSQGGDFNQMQMMMAMQNGMMPNTFGAFPMMGMLSITLLRQG